MKRWSIFFLLAFALVNAGGIGRAEELSNEICPVMGGKANLKIFTEYDGKRVYFCCPGCIPTFKKNPKIYLGKLPQFAEKELEKLRAKLRGVLKEIAKKERILHPKNAASEMAKLIYEETEKVYKETGIEVRGLLPMHPDALGNKIACPVMGTLFNIKEKSERSEYHGKAYYFCCPGCKAPFEKNPEKYLDITSEE
jgi:YHS domain-containing protein